MYKLAILVIIPSHVALLDGKLRMVCIGCNRDHIGSAIP